LGDWKCVKESVNGYEIGLVGSEVGKWFSYDEKNRQSVYYDCSDV
jgi:hypothetical protein